MLQQASELEAVQTIAEQVELDAPSLQAPVEVLSGGNQQKVYLSRCGLAHPKVLLLDEPTRGVDIGAKADIYALLRRWADQGVAIILTTSEIDELLSLSDQIIVLHRGRVAATIDGTVATRHGVFQAAAGTSETGGPQ
ncbi:MAG: sugar ABC transporter ATP-binding protein [Proteobacteria bacterium]|nr:sugar ABC transporter ATP-binding protein [Pseudomonadota bacterium]